MTTVTFPTQGEVLQFAFDAFGVLPQKYKLDEHFNETRKKSTQTALNRLAKEEGKLDAKLDELLTTFSYLVAGVLPPREALAFGDVFFDLFDTYRDALITEGTYLTKSETVKWQMLERSAPRLAISLAKHLQRYNIASDGLLVPAQAYWYLPKRDGDHWSWPLEQVMRWAYNQVETTILQFHCPQDVDLAHLTKNLDSAKNWLAGRTLPSWSSLLNNFDQSFGALDRLRITQGVPLLCETKKTSIRVALFLSRAATHVSKLVQEHFGDAVLDEVCSRFRLVVERAEDSTKMLGEYVQRVIASENIPPSEWDELWFDVVSNYWKGLAAQQLEVSQAVTSGHLTVKEAIKKCRPFGSLASLPFERPEAFNAQLSIPDGFVELLLDGLALRKSNELNLSSIQTYRTRLESQGLTKRLPWMVPWQQSTFHYREGRYAEAFPFIQEAYDCAKYCAGAKQYELVNRFIELAAKNGKRKEFTNGIDWATYLGIEVRLLRKSEPTKENLDWVFDMMKRAVWPA